MTLSLSGNNQRFQALQSWTLTQLHNLAPQHHWELHALAGDASARRYFRASSNLTQQGTPGFIVMDDPKAGNALNAFIAIAKTLNHAGLHTPQIFASDLTQGFLLLEDFGDHLLKTELEPQNGDVLFSAILPTLTKLTHCQQHQLPLFNATKIQQELDLLIDWYCKVQIQYTLTNDEHRIWQQLCTLLINTLEEIPNSFVHLDFHSCNIMRLSSVEPSDSELSDKLGLIDFQDAHSGPITYDLASWLWDRYITWPRKDITRWTEQARLSLAPQIDTHTWQRWCDFTGLQRNLKIVGIFARLCYRDQKIDYLALTPRFKHYIEDALTLYPELGFAKDLLQRLLHTPTQHQPQP